MTWLNVALETRQISVTQGTATLLLFLLAGLPANAQQTDNVTKEELRGSLRQERQQKAEDEASRGNVARLADGVKIALDSVAELEATTMKLYETLDDLMTNGDGKRIAMDDKAAETFMSMHSQPRMAIHTITTRKQFLSTLHSSLTHEFGDSVQVGFVPSDDQDKFVAEEIDWAEKMLVTVTNQRAWLKETLAQLPSDLDVSSAPTLEEVIEARAAELFLKEIAEYRRGVEKGLRESLEESRKAGHTVTVERAKIDIEQKLAHERAKNNLAKQESDRKLAEAEAVIAKLKNDMEIEIKRRTASERERLSAAEMEVKNKLAELERRELQSAADRYAGDAKAEIERTKTKHDADHLKNMAKAQTEEVKRLLLPFTTKGFMRANQRGETYDKKPHSLSGLRSLGALDPTIQGVKKLYNLATTKKDKVRPRWGKAKRWKNLNQATKEKAKKAQEYLIELGEALVELGMLTP